MDSREDRGAGVARVWIAVAMALAGTVALEALLLGEWLVPAVVGTALVALTVGVAATRKLRARSRPTLITVKDLRRR